MKKIKRMLSFFLMFALLVGLMPASVRADEAMTVSQEMVDVLKTIYSTVAASQQTFPKAGTIRHLAG